MTRNLIGRRLLDVTLDAIAANGTNSTEAIDLAGYQQVSVQVAHASHSDTSTWRIQVSNDAYNATPSNWDNVSGASQTTSGASGSASIDIQNYSYRWMRINISEADGGASSTLTARIIAKRKS